jgi:amino acid transporter
MRAAPAAPDPALRRTLGLLQVTMSGGGVILGAGVYALIGPASGYAGAALWLSFVIAALAAGLTAIPTPASPGAGRRTRPSSSTPPAFGPRVGFVAGWLMLARSPPPRPGPRWSSPRSSSPAAIWSRPPR